MHLVSRLTCVGRLPMLVACSASTGSGSTTTSGAASSSAQRFTLTAMDTMKFDPATLTAKAGQPIQVTLDNRGQLVHDFDISDGPAQPVKISAQPSQTASAT